MKRKSIIEFCIIVFLLSLLSIWLIDFSNVKNERDPVFCIEEKIHDFVDGSVYECVGLGYKVYRYDRGSIPKGIQFSPFFVKMKK